MITYHEQKGTVENPIISHSLMCDIDPEMGGHPLKFKANILGLQEEKDTVSLNRGNIVHLWQEHEDQFAIADLDKPTEQMAVFTDEFNDLYFKKGYERNSEFLKQTFAIGLQEVFTINEIYKSFYGQSPDNEQSQLLARCIFQARTLAQVDKRLLPPTVLERFQTKCMPYLRFLQKADGKIIIDAKTKDILNNLKENLKEHEFATSLIALCDKKEEEFFWDVKIGNEIQKHKAKVDRYNLNTIDKILTVLDFKTTSKPISNFDDEDGAYYKYKLGRQLANYVLAIAAKYDLQLNDYKINLYNIVFQMNGENAIQVFKTTENNFYNYLNELMDLKKRIQFHINLDMWNITEEEEINGYVTITPNYA